MLCSRLFHLGLEIRHDGNGYIVPLTLFRTWWPLKWREKVHQLNPDIEGFDHNYTFWKPSPQEAAAVLEAVADGHLEAE